MTRVVIIRLSPYDTSLLPNSGHVRSLLYPCDITDAVLHRYLGPGGKEAKLCYDANIPVCVVLLCQRSDVSLHSLL